MSQHFDKNASVEDYKLREKRLVIPFSIVHNASPASKTFASDLPPALVLALQGETSAAAAIDSGTNFTAPNDAAGQFGILLSSLGTVEKVLIYSVVNPSSGSVVVSLAGAASSGVTASGNIALNAVWTGSLATTDLSGNLVIEYRVSKA